MERLVQLGGARLAVDVVEVDRDAFGDGHRRLRPWVEDDLFARRGDFGVGGRRGAAHEGERGVFTANWLSQASFDPPLVMLSVENDKTFPLIFYRDNCADSALCEADIDEKFVASSAALLVHSSVTILVVPSAFLRIGKHFKHGDGS